MTFTNSAAGSGTLTATSVTVTVNGTPLTVDLTTGQTLGSSPVGPQPDVLAYDQTDHRLYVAAESGWVVILDLRDRRLTVVTTPYRPAWTGTRPSWRQSLSSSPGLLARSVLAGPVPAGMNHRAGVAPPSKTCSGNTAAPTTSASMGLKNQPACGPWPPALQRA